MQLGVHARIWLTMLSLSLSEALVPFSVVVSSFQFQRAQALDVCFPLFKQIEIQNFDTVIVYLFLFLSETCHALGPR